MLMHKPLERFYNYLVKITDKKINKIDAESKRKEASLARVYPNGLPCSIEGLEIKNPCRFL